MSLPFGTVDTTFERFLQELPADFRELAFEFKAFTRGRKIKTPEQLLQVVMNYCGIDLVLRETAGNFTLLEERISDTAIQKRLKACGPWVKALWGGCWGRRRRRCSKATCGLWWGMARRCRDRERKGRSIGCIWRWIWCGSS